MGEVISIGDWLRDRGLPPGGPSDDVARLERAVSMLEPLLEEVSERGRPGSGIDIEHAARQRQTHLRIDPPLTFEQQWQRANDRRAEFGIVGE